MKITYYFNDLYASKMNSSYNSSVRNGWKPKIGEKVIAVLIEDDMSTSTGNIWSEVEWNINRYDVVYPKKESYITKRLSNGNLYTYSTESYNLIEGEVGEIIELLLPETTDPYVRVAFKNKTGYVRLSYIEPYAQY